MNLKLQAFSSPPGLLKRGEGRRLRVCVCGGERKYFFKKGGQHTRQEEGGGGQAGEGADGVGGPRNYIF